MRLIDVEKVINKLKELRIQKAKSANALQSAWIEGAFAAIQKIIQTLEEESTVDAAPVIHGRWEECDWVTYDGHGECVRHSKEALCCSNCRNAFKKELLWKRNHCPNCGAKMDGGATDEKS